ncbi:MAG: hypothetical protein LH470_12465 [Lysobacter sp.]|nr:hypothetical protein [Lysobacter sp.]
MPAPREFAGIGRIGLGTLVSAIARLFGIHPCSGCDQRGRALNAIASIEAPVFFGTGMANATPCWMFTGRCTGFGRRQCVTAPESMSPDALMLEHCCGGWFQYPWIEVCDGQPPKRGCGFCFW